MQGSFEIAKQSEGLGIPYPPRVDPERNNIGYIDLKHFPQRIDEIYEILGWPEMRGFLLSLVADTSFFRPLRVDVWKRDTAQGSPFKRYVESYTTIAFEVLEINGHVGNFEVLWQRFASSPFIAFCDESTIVEFRAIPTSYNDHGINRSWSVDVCLVGFGQDDDEARKQWSCAVNSVSQFLIHESRLNRNELAKGKPRIS